MTKANGLRTFVVLTVLAAVLGLPGHVAAAGPAVVTTTGPATAVGPGEQFTVNIDVNPNNAIAGAQFSLSFNPTLVSVNSVTEGNLLKQGGADTYFMAGQIDNKAGTVSAVAGVIISPGQTVSGPGTLATITFTAGKTQGTCPLNLTDVVVGDMNGRAVAADVVNSQVVFNSPVLLAANAAGLKNRAEQAATFSWYILALIIGACAVAAAVTTAILLARRRALLKTWARDSGP